MGRGRFGWRHAMRWAGATIAAVVFLELVLTIAGLPSYAALVDPAAGFAPADRKIAATLQNEVARPGRGERIPGTILWRYRPGGSEPCRINSLGLRGPEPEPRRPDELRVAVLGGSTVYGWLVAEDAALPAAVERELTIAIPGRPVTVFNLGVEGFRFQQEVALLERLVDELDLDVAVFVTSGNDLLMTVLEGGFEPLQPWRGGPASDLLVTHFRQSGVLGTAREILKRSRIVTAIQLAWLRYTARRDLGPAAAERLGAELAAGFETTFELLRGIQARHALTAVVVLQPLVTDRPSPSLAEAVRRWRIAGAAPGLAAVAVQLRRRLLPRAPANLPIIVDGSGCAADLPGTVFQDWIHLSPAGNAACGAFVARVVLPRLPPRS